MNMLIPSRKWSQEFCIDAIDGHKTKETRGKLDDP